MLKKDVVQKKQLPTENLDSPNSLSQFIIPKGSELDGYFNLYRSPSTIKNLKLNDNYKLLSEKEIDYATTFILNDISITGLISGKKYTKKIFNGEINHSLLAIPLSSVPHYQADNHVPFVLYAEYPGRKKNSHIRSGEGFVDGWAQNLYTSKWVVRESIVKKPLRNFDNIVGPIVDEAKIAEALGQGQYYGHVKRQNSKGQQTIILRAKKGEDTLAEFLKNNAHLTMQQALNIGLRLLESYYYHVYTRGVLHRHINPSNIAIKTFHAEGEYAITFIHWWNGVLVRGETDENGHYHPFCLEKNAYGDPCYVGHDIAAKLLEKPDNAYQTAKKLAVYNTRVVLELITDKKNTNSEFIYQFVEALILRTTSDGKKHISLWRIKKYILPLLGKKPASAARLLANTVIDVIGKNTLKNEYDKITSELEEIHVAFKISLATYYSSKNNIQQKDPSILMDILYDEKSEIHQLAQILREVFQKTKAVKTDFFLKTQLYFRRLVFEFINQCQTINKDDKPTLLEGTLYFKNLLAEYRLSHSNQLSLDSVLNHKTQYVMLEPLQYLFNANIQINFSSLKNCKVTLALEKKQPDAVIDDIENKFKREGITLNKRMLVLEDPYHTKEKKLVPEDNKIEMAEENKKNLSKKKQVIPLLDLNGIKNSTSDLLKKLHPKKEAIGPIEIVDVFDPSSSILPADTGESKKERKPIGRKYTHSAHQKHFKPTQQNSNNQFSLYKARSTSNVPEENDNKQSCSHSNASSPKDHTRTLFFKRKYKVNSDNKSTDTNVVKFNLN